MGCRNADEEYSIDISAINVLIDKLSETDPELLAQLLDTLVATLKPLSKLLNVIKNLDEKGVLDKLLELSENMSSQCIHDALRELRNNRHGSIIEVLRIVKSNEIIGFLRSLKYFVRCLS